MQEILERISQKKKLLDQHGALPLELTKNLSNWFKVALTYSSNAIEGNTISFAETAEIIEKKRTVAGKSIAEHIEILNHAQALEHVILLAQTKHKENFELDDILSIHKIIFQQINDEWAGRLRKMAIRISGSVVPRPNYLKVPELMDEFLHEINRSQDHIAKIAADAHLKFVFIHPFVDGNGRTARLIINYLLLQAGYPIVFIKVEDRQNYIDGIEKALFSNDYDDYYQCIFQAIEYSLDEYLQGATTSKLEK